MPWRTPSGPLAIRYSHPFVLGSGQRLFDETSDIKTLCLVDIRTVGDNLALLTYQPARET